MKYVRLSAAVAAGVAVAALMTAGPAGAGIAAPDPELAVTPTSGPVGTTIELHGNRCDGGFASFALVVHLGGESYWPLVVAPREEAAEDGTWDGALEVPESYTLDDGEVVPVEPGDAYTVFADCDQSDEDGGAEGFGYDLVDFTVTGDGPTPTTAPPTTAPPSAPTPPPATPISDDPPFTG